jgi:DNA adenine methylase
MPVTPSPLRYPGGKTKLYNYIRSILRCNNLSGKTYVEPFAGGSGLSIKLLLKGDVSHIVINDYDFSIFSFWWAILSHTDEFCDLIAKTDISPNEWRKQRKIYFKCDKRDPLALGFSTFYLNRTNISGVINGGLIGGLNQTGPDNMNARFNKDNLIKKIYNIATYKNSITLYNLDAIELISQNILEQFGDLFINFDPPYVKKGAKLYKNFYNETDHRILSRKISEYHKKLVVTYDVCPLVSELYSSFRYAYLDITYSVKNSKKAQEYIFFSDNLIIPNEISIFAPLACR